MQGSERSQSKKGEYDSNHMLIYKRQDYRDNKKIHGYKGLVVDE